MYRKLTPGNYVRARVCVCVRLTDAELQRPSAIVVLVENAAVWEAPLVADLDVFARHRHLATSKNAENNIYIYAKSPTKRKNKRLTQHERVCFVEVYTAGTRHN